MEFFETVKNRCSVREYEDKPIETPAFHRMIDAARLAPTARGEQPWEFIVITDAGRLKELGKICPNGKFLAGAAACVIVVSKITKYYLEDGSAATTQLLLAARALGIGSCWIAGDKKEYADHILELMEVPSGYKLVSLISLGYPKEGFHPHEKRSVEEVMHTGTFST
ncbi:MAG: nitroreductase family protein [Candidatus Omnitrophica bacterium]|nr:nitroreductase family protein [Candidatus Omnitrophota bacterium]